MDEPKSIPELTSVHAQLIGLFEDLPIEEQQELLMDLLKRRKNIKPVVDDGNQLPLVVEGRRHVHVAFWLNAIGEHKLGHPDRLVRMVSSCVPLVGVAGTYISELIKESAKRSLRGRPRKKETAKSLHAIAAGLMREHSIRLYFSQRVEAWAKESKDLRMGHTPSEKALDETAEKFAISTAEAKRAVFGKNARTRKARIY